MVMTCKQVANRFNKHLRDDKDIVVAITGDEGSGKSACAIELGMACDPAFDLERNILYSPNFDEMKNKVVGLPKYSAIIADEAIKSLYKLQWQSRLQQYINILYGICRQENKLSILCMPRFADFNEYFRQHRIRIWIHVIEPISRTKTIGHAVIFSQSWNPVTQDSWNLKDLQKAIDTYSRQKNLKEIEFDLPSKRYVMSKSRNYVGMLEFHHIPDELFADYSLLKRQYAYEDMDSADIKGKGGKVEARYKDKMRLLIEALRTSGKTYAEIAMIIKTSEGRVKQLVYGEKDPIE